MLFDGSSTVVNNDLLFLDRFMPFWLCFAGSSTGEPACCYAVLVSLIYCTN
jgi:hypothetical protein